MTTEPSTKEQLIRRQSVLETLTPLRRVTEIPSDSQRFTEATARYYGPFTRQLSTADRHRNFSNVRDLSTSQSPRLMVNPDELKRFSIIQVRHRSLLMRIKRYSHLFSRLIRLVNYSMQTMI